MKPFGFAALIVLGTLSTAYGYDNNQFSAETRTFQAGETWGLNQNSSSAPQPSCPCDLDVDTRDCPDSFTTNENFGDVCYDEYIPQNSDGFVYARVFRLVAD